MAVYFHKREVVVPGQLLADGRYRASDGTYDTEDGKIYSALVGLAELRGNTVKVVPLEGAYLPKEGDLVIGTITIVAGNNWKVDIGGPYLASLHANNALRRPYSDDISEYMDIGDVIVAEITAFDRRSGPFLSMKGRGLRKLEGGMLLEVSPAKIPRIIGRRGSMINMIKDHLRIQTIVGQNGRIWIKAKDTETLRLAIKAIRTVEEQAHTSKLTDRINNMLEEALSSRQSEAQSMSGEGEVEETAPTSSEEPVDAETPEVPESTSDSADEEGEDSTTEGSDETAEPKEPSEGDTEETAVAEDEDQPAEIIDTEEVSEE
ncbi:MAG: exosome complex RNA-binding protein Rrp4 [Candidatus Thorarchaeota archaeon]